MCIRFITASTPIASRHRASPSPIANTEISVSLRQLLARKPSPRAIPDQQASFLSANCACTTWTSWSGDSHDAKGRAFVMNPPWQISTRMLCTGSNETWFTNSNNCLSVHVYFMSHSAETSDRIETAKTIPRRNISCTDRDWLHALPRTFRVGPNISCTYSGKIADEQI